MNLSVHEIAPPSPNIYTHIIYQCLSNNNISVNSELNVNDIKLRGAVFCNE